WTEYSAIWAATETANRIELEMTLGAGQTLLIDNIHVHEVGPGCVGADDYALDWWTKTTTLDLLRVQEDTTHGWGLYQVKAVKGAATAEYLNPFGKGYNLKEHYFRFRGRTVTFGCWVYSVGADDNVKLVLEDSAGSTTSAAYCPADTLTWMEVTHTVSAAATYFYPRILFDGDAADVAYVSQPTLVFGSSLGQGNYVYRPGEEIELEASLAAHSFNAVTVSVDTTRYYEAESSGRLPKGAAQIFGRLGGTCANANKLLTAGDSSFGSGRAGLRAGSQVGAVPTYGEGRIYVTTDGAFTVGRNDTFTLTVLHFLSVKQGG
ncbi:MAG: hypothetical protein AB1896_19670, partial [Thermodesulfobacteriota bacterium]